MIGEVVPHPSRADVLGLQNRSQDPWEARLATGETHTVYPGKSIRISPDLALDLGPVTARFT